MCEVASCSWISRCLAPLGISRTLSKPENEAHIWFRTPASLKAHFTVFPTKSLG